MLAAVDPQVLSHLRFAAGAETASECAWSYYLYGVSLLEKARSDSDVFGAKVQDAADAKTKALIQEAMAEPGPADEGQKPQGDHAYYEQPPSLHVCSVVRISPACSVLQLVSPQPCFSCTAISSCTDPTLACRPR